MKLLYQYFHEVLLFFNSSTCNVYKHAPLPFTKDKFENWKLELSIVPIGLRDYVIGLFLRACVK